MKKLWRTVKNAVTFTIQATHPIADHIIVDKFLICINRTQAYNHHYLEFKRLPDQRYTSLRTHFTAAERNRQEVKTRPPNMDTEEMPRKPRTSICRRA